LEATNLKEIFVPAVGTAMEECILVSWLKHPGDEVVEGEDIAIIETDKATMELESPASGRLGPHFFVEGSTVPVGATLAQVFDGAEEREAEAPRGDSANDSEIARREGASSTAQPTGMDSTEVQGQPAHEAATETRRPHELSPRQRRLMAEQTSTSRAAESASGAELLYAQRHATARAVAESWRTIPHFSVTCHVRAEVVKSVLTTIRSTAPSVSMTDLFLRALALTFKDRDPSNDNVGLAVATESGVAIPVLPSLSLLSLKDVAAARLAAVKRARAGRMLTQDLQPAHCTLSNLGSYGVEHFTGIIPLDQAALLTVGKAEQRPLVVNGSLAVVTTFYATLNVDHRLFDGVHAASILQAFADTVNDAGRLTATS
jgi:pyruvate dehydrogenase E2 component (dihydrolipoamide acetyltransferase)